MPTPNREQRDEIIKAIIESRKADTNLVELSAAFFSSFGGIDGFIKELKLFYDSARSEGDKAKILLMGVDLVKQCASLKKHTEDPMSKMSDEQLAAAAVAIMGRMNDNSKPTVDPV